MTDLFLLEQIKRTTCLVATFNPWILVYNHWIRASPWINSQFLSVLQMSLEHLVIPESKKAIKGIKSGVMLKELWELEEDPGSH